MAVNDKNSPILAVDIGGSKLLCGIVTREGKILGEERKAFPKGYNEDELFTEIYKLCDSLIKEYKPSLCGITIPGLADAKTGSWVYAPFSGLSDIPVAERIRSYTGLPSYADNDVNACALGEMYFGVCRDTNDFLWITVSNGIGGGLVLSGNLYRGEGGASAEIGHFIVDDGSDRKCGCGNNGCLEALASGRGIARSYLEMTGRETDTKEVASRASRGEKEALEVFDKAGYYLGKAIAYSVNLLNISRVVVGGGVSNSFDLLLPSVQKALDRFLFKAANRNVTVVKSANGDRAALVGAAALALKAGELNK